MMGWQAVREMNLYEVLRICVDEGDRKRAKLLLKDIAERPSLTFLEVARVSPLRSDISGDKVLRKLCPVLMQREEPLELHLSLGKITSAGARSLAELLDLRPLLDEAARGYASPFALLSHARGKIVGLDLMDSHVVPYKASKILAKGLEGSEALVYCFARNSLPLAGQIECCAEALRNSLCLVETDLADESDKARRSLKDQVKLNRDACEDLIGKTIEGSLSCADLIALETRQNAIAYMLRGNGALDRRYAFWRAFQNLTECAPPPMSGMDKVVGLTELPLKGRVVSLEAHRQKKRNPNPK